MLVPDVAIKSALIGEDHDPYGAVLRSLILQGLYHEGTFGLVSCA